MEWNATYPEKFRLFSLGQSVNGRELWACEVSREPGNNLSDKPNVKYIGNMHGDEVVGRELLMKFLDTLVTESEDSAVSLLDSANVFVVPSMNPDGFAAGVRANANGFDLNRNFPDQFRTVANRQKETTLVMNFLASRQWILSANFHGGDLVANYPWDGRPDNIFRGENKSPDDDVFRFISATYSRTNAGMMANTLDTAFHNGTVNGAAWYVLFGGMQDFNYIHHGCMEITLEVSMNKWPGAYELPTYWAQNHASMFNYLSLVNTAIRGRVLDHGTSLPVAGARVYIKGREVSKLNVTSDGQWFRILPLGTRVELVFEAPGYHSVTANVTNWDDSYWAKSSSGFYLPGASTRLDIRMFPIVTPPSFVPYMGPTYPPASIPFEAPEAPSSSPFTPPYETPSSIPVPITPVPITPVPLSSPEPVTTTPVACSLPAPAVKNVVCVHGIWVLMPDCESPPPGFICLNGVWVMLPGTLNYPHPSPTSPTSAIQEPSSASGFTSAGASVLLVAFACALAAL